MGFPTGRNYPPQVKKKRTIYEPSSVYLPKKSNIEVCTIESEPEEATIHNPKNENGEFNKAITICLVKDYPDDAVCEHLWHTEYKAKSAYYFSSIDFSSYTSDKNGKTYQNEMKFLRMGFNEIEKFKDAGEDDGFEYSIFKLKRLDGDTSPSVGDTFKFRKKADPEELFPIVQYNGRLLSEIFEEANNNPDVMEEVKKIFKVELDKKGKIIPKLVGFNFEELLKAKHPNYLRKVWKLDKPTENKSVPMPPTPSKPANKAIGVPPAPTKKVTAPKPSPVINDESDDDDIPF